MIFSFEFLKYEIKSPETISNTIIMSAAMGFFCLGLKNEFEITGINEPSVFEPLKFCCNKIKKHR